MYVVSWYKLLKPEFFSLKGKRVRQLEVDMNFTNELNWNTHRK